MDFGLLIPILAILMGPVMYLIYLKEVRLKRSHQLEDLSVAQHAGRIDELERRVRVLEKIVTDGGMQTAAQIEALREVPVERMPAREKVL